MPLVGQVGAEVSFLSGAQTLTPRSVKGINEKASASAITC